MYGGSRAFFSSPYLYVSIILTIVLAPIWVKHESAQTIWTQYALSIIPNILGFSMGGMAITLSFTSHGVFRFLKQNGSENSLFMIMNANFMHFIIAQVTCLIFALISLSYSNSYILSFFGCSVFIYAILSCLMISAQILNSARIFNAHIDNNKNDNKSGSTVT